jgi:potassium-transporting ATPase ATP-binding subunit
MRPIDEVGTTVRETTVNGAGAGGVSRSRSLFDREILAHALVDALRKFNPRAQMRNPVMFVVRRG